MVICRPLVASVVNRLGVPDASAVVTLMSLAATEPVFLTLTARWMVSPGATSVAAMVRLAGNDLVGAAAEFTRQKAPGQLDCFRAQWEAASFPVFSPWMYSLDNMLPETAYMKLGWVLGQTDDPKRIREMMTTPVNHEITPREPHNGYLVMQGGLPETEEWVRGHWK